MANHAPTGVVASIERGPYERVFLDLVTKVADAGSYVSNSRNSERYAPVVFGRRPDREGFKRADFARAMEKLFAEKKIHVGLHKTPARHDCDCIKIGPPPAAPGCAKSAPGAPASSLTD